MSDDTRVAREAAIRLLAQREHSQFELIQKLSRRGFGRDLLDDLLATLAEQGLQCDERFAEAFARARYAKGQGPLKIRAGLSAKGISQHLAAKACQQPELDWHAQCEQVFVRKFGDEPVTDYAQRAKCFRFLAQRGFARDHIDAAMSSSRR